MNHLEPDPPPSFWKSSAGLTLLVAAMVGGFYLVTEHRAHLFGLLPYLILLACLTLPTRLGLPARICASSCCSITLHFQHQFMREKPSCGIWPIC